MNPFIYKSYHFNLLLLLILIFNNKTNKALIDSCQTLYIQNYAIFRQIINKLVHSHFTIIFVESRKFLTSAERSRLDDFLHVSIGTVPNTFCQQNLVHQKLFVQELKMHLLIFSCKNPFLQIKVHKIKLINILREQFIG